MDKQKILFSPLGGTDPISNFRDGSMLHICRIYKPDIVILYMSKEMYDYHVKDNRYLYCLDKLSELIDHKFDVKLIERPELTEVQDFDYFYQEFETLLREIHKEYEGEILLNISSGTPAMKNALNIMADLMEIRLHPIQVVTPEGKINSHEEDKDNYDVESYWDLNQDNDPDTFYDRTTLIKSRNQTAMFTINNIRKLIDACDYPAALDLARSIHELIPQKAIQLLEIACARINLDYSSYTKAGGNKYSFMPVQGSDARDIVEYILILQIKAEKEEYADLLRAITPVFFELCKMVVRKRCGIDLEKVTYVSKTTGAFRWKNNLQNIDKKLYDFFIESYGKYRGGYVVSDQLTKMICKFDTDPACKKAFDEFRGIEEAVRNIAAHNLVSITDDWIKSKCGCNINQIVKKLKSLVVISGIKVTSDSWDSYAAMNTLIKEAFLLEV